MELNPDMEFIGRLKSQGCDELKKCFQCATCSCVCNLSPADKPFPRKEMLWASWGLKEQLVNDPDIWLCHYCNDCTANCPRGVRPGNVMASVRQSVISHYAKPKFMSKAFSSPAYIALLILLPLVMFSAFFYSNLQGDLSRINSGTIVFARFFPHNILEYFWIGGNVLVFGLAGLSLYRFTAGIRSGLAGRNNNNQLQSKTGFMTAAYKTVKEILVHRNFSACPAAGARKIGHMLVFFGFFGAMATAGLALIADLFFGMPAPIGFFHPIKILGNVSGVMLFTGCTIFLAGRLTNKDGNLKSSYFDWSFLLILYMVSISGLATQFSRIAESPALAYGVYILHMTFIFLLLWFVMYSKFAHIFYRTLAIILARQQGREVTFNN